MKAIQISLFVIVLGMVLGSNAYADSRVKSKYTTGGQSTETTVSTKDSRQRLDAGPGIAMINQCDVQRSIQLFEQRKSYMVFPTDGQSTQAGTPAAANSTGGIVTYTVNITDTGERKTMFGYTARHMKSVSTKDAGPNTCNPGRETLEFDGWYIDYEPEVPMCLANTNKIQAPPSQPRCNDQVKVNQTGDGKLGYPLSYTLKTTKEDGSSTVMEMQVTDFSTSTLDNSFFEIPSGYSELKSTADFSAALGAHLNTGAAPGMVQAGVKPSGTIRVGVAELTNHSSASTGSARDQLVAALAAAHVDAVPLQGESPSEIEESAKKYDVDYIVYADVAETKKPSGGLGKFGGVLSKASTISGGGTAGSTKEKIEAKVNYKLMQPGSSKPFLSATSSGSNGGGFSLGSAISLAANVTPMAMFMRMGLFNPNMMRALSGANSFGAGTTAAGIPGMPRGGLAPGMGSFMPMLQATQSLIGSSKEQTEESKAVADALNETAKSIAEALKKKK
jgi:hypothetical protein